MKAKGILDILGFAGVIGSLVFVGLQVRQNTLALRATAVQESINVARQQLQMLATNPDLVQISQRINDGEEVSEVDRTRHASVLGSFFWGMQGLYQQWTLGVLADEEWEVWQRVICRNVAAPATRRVWQERFRDLYVADFVARVDSCATEGAR